MTRQQIIKRFEELIVDASGLYKETLKQETKDAIIDSALYFKLLSSTKLLFTYLEAKTYLDLIEHYCSSRLNAGILQGVLESGKQEFGYGLLNHPKILITAESIETLIEQAEYLLEQDYKDAACTLTGGTLELTLKSLLKNKFPQVPFNPKSGIDDMNKKLLEVKAYDSSTFKLIDGYRELRNWSSHGDYEKYNKDKVKEFIFFLRNFISNHYAVKN
jgi:hypothetical protein